MRIGWVGLLILLISCLLSGHSLAANTRKVYTTDKANSYVATEVEFPGGASIVHPGERVVLKLPWIEQTPGEGICVAASAINILQSLDPKLNMTQDQLYETMTNGIKRMDDAKSLSQTGGTDAELSLAVGILGYKIAKEITPPFADHLDEIKAELDNKHPIEVFACGLSDWDDDPKAKGSGHAFILMGYRADSLIFWDQASLYGIMGQPFSVKVDEVNNFIRAMCFIEKKGGEIKAPSEMAGASDIASSFGDASGASSPQAVPVAPGDPQLKIAQERTGLELKKYQVSLKGRSTVDENYDLRLAKVCTTLLNNREKPVLYTPAKYAVLLWEKSELGWFRAKVYEGDNEPTEVNLKYEDLKNWVMRDTHDEVDNATFFGAVNYNN